MNQSPTTPDFWVGKIVTNSQLNNTVLQGNPEFIPVARKTTPQAVKHDLGKTDWSLVPWDSVEEIIKVLEFGAGKYNPWNWAESGGFKYNRLFNSSMRHFIAWFWRREDSDPETGLSHMAHLGCNVLFILHYVLNGNKFKNNDNRPNL